MKTFYVIRRGWNAANQSAMGGRMSARNTFESRYDTLVDIVQAESKEDAEEMTRRRVTVYNGQTVYATSNPWSIKGLTAEIRKFPRED